MSKERPNNGKSLSQQLHEQLREIIAETPSGGKLLSEPQLAKQLGVSRATLREAMRTFETQGFIHRRQGVGTFVIPPGHMIEAGLEVLESIHTQAERMDLEVQVGPYYIIKKEASEQSAERLEINPGEPVIEVTWVMETQGRPVAYLVDVLPEDVLDGFDLERNFNGSVLDMLMSDRGPTLSISRTEISAVAAPSDIARAMGIQRGDVVLFFEATLFTAEGRVIDYSHSYYLPGYFKFHVVRRVGQGGELRG
ncbi:MAG: GntR family transcriptional regulator [Chloroflexota bacterium]